ncbi:MAG: hypothetical protein H6738_22350 [Alphaproteobacteria bacterium]|nr:hypothetical protein [Alphaproteobacteria bacterium]MCB9699542.1 hypothetical protein [Alphaproteobacteria bacterium]
MLVAALLAAPAAHAQSCGGASYNTDPAAFAALNGSDFQNVAVNTQSRGHTEASPYVFEGVAYWPDFWVTNSFCIPGMDSGVCGGTNNYLGNFWQTWMAPATPSDAFGFRWGTQGSSATITVYTSDGASYPFVINGQTDFFGYCTGSASVTVTKILIESADGGIDDVVWGSLSGGPPPFEVQPLQLLAGFPTNLAAAGAQPGETVWFLGSLATGAGPCPALLGGQCLDLLQPQVLGSAVADANGSAVLQVLVPAGISGQTAYVQAAIRRGAGGVDSVVAPVRSAVVF